MNEGGMVNIFFDCWMLVWMNTIIFVMISMLSIWQCSSSKGGAQKPSNNKKNGKNGAATKKTKEKKKRRNGSATSSPGKTLTSVQGAPGAAAAGQIPAAIRNGTKPPDKAAKGFNNNNNLKKPPRNGKLAPEQPTQPLDSAKHKKSMVKIVAATNTKNAKPPVPAAKKKDKSLRPQSTQFSAHSTKQENVRKTQSDDEGGTERQEPPELAVDKTQKSVSIRRPDDEDTNSNIEELPMDKHKSE